jgi:hypothetical protein
MLMFSKNLPPPFIICASLLVHIICSTKPGITVLHEYVPEGELLYLA